MRAGQILIGLIVLASLGRGAPALAESANALKARALQLYRAGAYQDALPLFDELLKRRPRDLETYNTRGSIYLRLHQPERALADFDAAIRLNPPMPALSFFSEFPSPPVSAEIPDARANRGIALLMLGQPDAAIEAFNQAKAIYEKDSSWNMPWSRKDKASPDTGLADAFHALGRDEQALRAYDQALQYDPQCAVAYHGRGIIYAALGRYDQALADLSAAIRLDDQATADQSGPIGPESEESRATREARVGPSRRPPRTHSSRARTHDARGSVLARLGRNEEALADFEAALRFDPSFAAAANHRGALLVPLGRFESALEDLDRALQIDPNRASAYQNRAAAYNSLGRFEAAVSDCETALRLDPNSVGAHNNRGLAFFGLGQYDRALSDFDAVIRLAPSLASARLTRGNALLRLGQPARAILDFEAALGLEPRLPGAYLGLGLALEALGRFVEAIPAYDLAIGLDPRQADAYFSRGGARRALGDWSGALIDFDASLGLDPRRADAYLARAWARFLTGQEGANADARAYIELRGTHDPAAPMAAILGSLAARWSGRQTEARALLERVAADMDKNAWPYPIVAYLTRAITARILLEAAAEPAHTAEAHLFIGIDRLLDRRWPEALEQLRWVRDQGQSSPTARTAAAMLLPRLEAPPNAAPLP